MGSRLQRLHWLWRSTSAALALVAAAEPGGVMAAAGLDASTLDTLHERCVDDMVRQTCRVMDPAQAATLPPGAVLFIAGIGPVDARVYNELRASGLAMCEIVRRKCAADASQPSCRTARAMYGRGAL